MINNNKTQIGQMFINITNQLLLVNINQCHNQPFSHPDMWLPIAWHVKQRQPGDIRVFKVKAHQMDDTQVFQTEHWMEYANRCADEHAKAVFASEHQALFSAMQSHVQRIQNQEKMMIQFHDYVCQIADRYFAHDQKRPKDTSLIPDFCMLQPVVTDLGPFVISDSQVSNWPFGPTFASRFVSWWNTLTWTDEGIVSTLELYVDFAVTTGSLVPVSLPNRKWVLRDENIVADESSLAMNLQSRTWTQILQWILPKIDFTIPILQRGRGLHHVGYTIPVYTFAGRPKLHIGSMASQILWNYFHRSGATVRDMKATWHPKSCVPAGA